MASDNSGPAFPVPECKFDDGRIYMHAESGMTLRDYFAAKELAKTPGPAVCDESSAYARLATHCYRMADAMLAERAK